MDIVSSRYYAYVNGTYDVQQIELSHFYNNFDVRKNTFRNIGGHGSWVKGGVYTLGVSKKIFGRLRRPKNFCGGSGTGVSNNFFVGGFI